MQNFFERIYHPLTQRYPHCTLLLYFAYTYPLYHTIFIIMNTILRSINEELRGEGSEDVKISLVRA